MTRALLITAAILVVGCGPDGQQRQASTDSSAGAASAQPGSNGAGNGLVTLVGCLHEGSLPGVAGTTGSDAADSARARAIGQDTTASHNSAVNARFTLTNARIESADANVTGAAGGTLPGPTSSVELDAVPAAARASVNKQVRVTGRIVVTQAAVPGSSSDTSASPRDDVRANSTAVAGADASRRVTVEAMQPIADSCLER
jgi:hypothetical protein